MAPGDAIETDAVVVGAGPVGLFQVFQLGLLEVAAHVVDSLPAAGGQCVELYGDKPIYDIPGLPFCTGRELAERLLKQIEPFRAGFHFGHEVGVVERRADGRFDVATQRGLRFVCKVVVVAGGVGSFQPRRLKIDGLERHEEAQLFHRVPDADATAGRRVAVVGNDEHAVDAALRLASDGPQRAGHVALLHRRDDFHAPAAKLAALREARAAGRIEVVVGQVTGIGEGPDGRIATLAVTGSDGVTRPLLVDVLLVLLGLSPRLGPIAHWGLALDRKQVVIDTETFETAVPGVFAVGDVVTYPGKKKLIVCGFHEATLAAFGAVRRVDPERRVQLQYTTTSPRLHHLLGVTPPAGAPPT
jgi:thioredoxin reductase (NADPH)